MARKRTKTRAEQAVNNIEDQFDEHFKEVEVDFDIEYDPLDHPIMVIEEMSRGASIEELCLLIGILPSVLADWFHIHSGFRDAIVEGSMLALAWWKSQGRLNLHQSDFQIGLYKLEMANRFGYVNKNKPTMKDLEDPRYLVEAIDDDIIDVKKLSYEDLKKNLKVLKETDGQAKRSKTNRG